MKLLVTGAGGFMGRNLVAALHADGKHDVMCFHHSQGASVLEKMAKDAEFVIHLAGVNRPEHDDEFLIGNADFTHKLVDILEQAGNRAPVLYASSTQVLLDNAYGHSKKEAEDILRTHADKMYSNVYIYRLTNVFGKWCRPQYNSVVATFCHNIAYDLPVRVDNAQHMLTLAYIDDIVVDFIRRIEENETGAVEVAHKKEIFAAPVCYRKTVGEIEQLLRGFKDMRATLAVPDLSDSFVSKLYSTYLSYLPEDGFGYPLMMHRDDRGSFTEFMRTDGQGQFSVNVAHPGVEKGNHWHQSKHEKFLVVSGEGLIRFRKIGVAEVLEYPVSGKRLEIIEIPPGYTHSIKNVGQMDMVTLMWANECFDPKHPDTYPEGV
jgi:UDP-2-acetamido-2,6-beta-L-arabino-hexul-4-ose reductase